MLRQGCQEVASKITSPLAELKPKARNLSLSQQTVQSRETKWLLSKGGSSLLVLWQKRLFSLWHHMPQPLRGPWVPPASLAQVLTSCLHPDQNWRGRVTAGRGSVHLTPFPPLCPTSILCSSFLSSR